MKKLKILQITDSKHVGGGSQEHIRILCKYLDKKKFESLIVCRPGPLAEFYREQGFETIPVELRYHYKSILRLIKIIKEREISIVHTHNLLADKVGCVAGKLARVPVIISTLHKLVNISSGKRKYNFPIWLHNHIVKYLTDKIITVSDAVRKTALKELKVNPSKIITIYNATDVSKFQEEVPESEIQTLRKELSIKPTDIVIATIGRLTSGKGYEYFMEAIPLVLSKNKDVSFLLLGKGKLNGNLKTLAESLGVANNVVFAGYRPDVSKILKIVDIVVIPSFAEGLSRVILEAMASKKAVIATNVGGNSEAIVENETGMLIQPGNPQVLAKTILRLLSNRQEMKRMGEAGFCRVKEKFDAPVFIQKTEKIFEECVSQKLKL